MSASAEEEIDGIPRAASEFTRLYYEAAETTWKTTSWMGVPAQKLPLDMWILQEIVFETQPDLIIETGVAEGGSTLFFANLLDLLGKGEVYAVDVQLNRVHEKTREHPRVTLVEGSSVAPDVVAQLTEAASGRRVLLDLDSNHAADHVHGELDKLAPLVSPGSYVIVEDGVIGRPVEPEFGAGPSEAVELFLASNPPFVVDAHRDRLMASFNPGGYLRRIGDPDAEPAGAERAAGNGHGQMSSDRRPPGDGEGGTDELRAALAEIAGLRERLAQIEPEHEELKLSLARSSDRIVQLNQALESARDELSLQDPRAPRGRSQADIERELIAVRLRLRRIQSLLPVRAYNRMRELPPLSWIARRRLETFEEDFERAKNRD